MSSEAQTVSVTQRFRSVATLRGGHAERFSPPPQAQVELSLPQNASSELVVGFQPRLQHHDEAPHSHWYHCQER